MSLKAKLVSSIAAFCLVLALMVVGIFAANQVEVNLGGSITYTANDVIATIDVTDNDSQIDWHDNLDAKKQTVAEGSDTLNLEFDKNQTIVITVVITNKSNENMTVTAATPTVDNGLEISYEITAGGSEQETYTAVQTVAASQSITYQISLTLPASAANNDIVNGAWNADFTLNRVNA